VPEAGERSIGIWSGLSSSCQCRASGFVLDTGQQGDLDPAVPVSIEEEATNMYSRIVRHSLKLAVIAAIAVLASAGAALAYSYVVVFGTSGNDVIDESVSTNNVHVYGFQGSDTITGSSTSISGGSYPGFDWLYGDGQCSQTPPGDDSYCETPGPFEPQPWTDSAKSSDTITGGTGPDWIVGGGGNDVITGSRTYDVIVAGPHTNTITAGSLGSTIIETAVGAKSTIALQASRGASYGGLAGVFNWVDVYNQTPGDKVSCSNTANRDVVFGDTGDKYKNCFLTISLQCSPATLCTGIPQRFVRYPPGMGLKGGAPAERDTSALGVGLRLKPKQVIRIRIAQRHGRRYTVRTVTLRGSRN
jgi:hypothetical protein